MPKELEDIIRDVHGANNEEGTDTKSPLYRDLRNELPPEICPLCERYEQGTCPTTLRMEQECSMLADDLVRTAEGETGDEREYLLKTSRYLRARTPFIKECAYDYVDTIGKMASLKSQRHYFDETVWQEKLLAIDTLRSRRHDALIATLRGLTEKILELIEEGYLSKEDVTFWRGWHDDVRNRTTKITVFSMEIASHQHRKVVQDWAVSADIMESLALIKKTQDQ